MLEVNGWPRDAQSKWQEQDLTPGLCQALESKCRTPSSRLRLGSDPSPSTSTCMTLTKSVNALYHSMLFLKGVTLSAAQDGCKG